jgi:hypothetical protein
VPCRDAGAHERDRDRARAVLPHRVMAAAEDAVHGRAGLGAQDDEDVVAHLDAGLMLLIVLKLGLVRYLAQTPLSDS